MSIHMGQNTRSLHLRFGATLAAVAAVTFLAVLTRPLWEQAPYPLFLAAVVFAAWYGGLGPGLLATVLSCGAIDFFFLPPIYSLGLGLLDAARLGVFVLVAVSISSLDAARKRAEATQARLIGELQEALAQVKSLSGLLSICASCKKIRDERGDWSQVEAYIRDHSEADFSHGICPECAQKLYPEYFTEKTGETRGG
jgi:K+-sensing histidine kinase KdpD